MSPAIMLSLPSSSLFLFSLLFLLFHSPSVADDALYQFCGSINYTAHSNYESNLKLLLPSLAVNASLSGGYYEDSIGQEPDQVYGLVLCRGDVNDTECRSCLNTASRDIVQFCPHSIEAVIWYDNCLLRYSNRVSLATTRDSQKVFMWNVNNVTDPLQFDKLVNELLNALTDWAAYNATKRFATGEVNFTTDFPTIYGLVQCTPNLWDIPCRQCLQEIINPMPKYLQGKQGGRAIQVHCNYRYEVYTFYEGESVRKLPSPTPAAAEKSKGPTPAATEKSKGPTPAATKKGNKKNVTGMVLKIALPVVVSLSLLVSITCICFRRRRKSAKYLLFDEASSEEITHESLLLDLSMLRTATSNFSEENKLGEGGFGAVYKGVLPNGQELAAKRLSTTSRQGLTELKNELVLVAKLRHKNLVRLVGACLEEQERLLVYEYVPNRSLDIILFDTLKREQLYWEKRYKIIRGIARGLLYLHEDSQLKIIHRDLKAGNILLDADLNPKISDFGLARLFDGDLSHNITNRVVGTFGYMAPEYVMHGQFSLKSDVYSYGVLVLEIITGRKNSGSSDSASGTYLLTNTWEQWNKGTVLEMVDPCLLNNYPKTEVLKCFQIGLLCVQENSSDRPDMSTVVMMLNNDPVTIQSPSQPAFFMGQHIQSLKRLVPMASNEVSITELEPR